MYITYQTSIIRILIILFNIISKEIPELGSFVQWIKKNTPPKKGPLPFSTPELENIKKILQDIIIFHLEKKPKTLRYLK